MLRRKRVEEGFNVHSINIVERVAYVLDIAGGDVANGFFHINGVTGDGKNQDYHLLNNTDNGR